MRLVLYLQHNNLKFKLIMNMIGIILLCEISDRYVPMKIG